MMSRLRPIINLIGHYKYVVTIIIGIVIVGFLDENSFLKRVQLELEVENLETEIEKYKKIHDNNTRQLKELKYNPDAFGRIARERYFMKADDEDIYVLSDDRQLLEEENETIE